MLMPVQLPPVAVARHTPQSKAQRQRRRKQLHQHLNLGRVEESEADGHGDWLTRAALAHGVLTASGVVIVAALGGGYKQRPHGPEEE